MKNLKIGLKKKPEILQKTRQEGELTVFLRVISKRTKKAKACSKEE